MQTACTLDTLEIFSHGMASLEKGDVGQLVVSLDIFMVCYIFCMLFFLQANQRNVAKDIDNAEVTASDFTIELRNLPKVSNMSTTEFKAVLWEWIETQCKQRGDKMDCPDTR
jgi:hypothetical protein